MTASRRNLLKAAAAVPVMAFLPIPVALAAQSDQFEIAQLWAEIQAIDGMHFGNDDEAGDAAADRQTELEYQLLRTPARDRGDILIKAQLAKRQAECGKPTSQPHEAIDYLITDLKAAVFS